MEFREVDKSNYWDCIALTVDDSQVDFVADNKQSLVEAAYEDGLYVLGIYNEDTMVGFVLYDYDESFPGWSMSRFMANGQLWHFLNISRRNTMPISCISAYPWITRLHGKCILTLVSKKSKR